jgi:hypothetical protein
VASLFYFKLIGKFFELPLVVALEAVPVLVELQRELPQLLFVLADYPFLLIAKSLLLFLQLLRLLGLESFLLILQVFLCLLPQLFHFFLVFDLQLFDGFIVLAICFLEKQLELLLFLLQFL